MTTNFEFLKSNLNYIRSTVNNVYQNIGEETLYFSSITVFIKEASKIMLNQCINIWPITNLNFKLIIMNLLAI